MGCGGLEDVPDAREALAGVVWQEVAALVHQAGNRVALQGWVVAAGEGVQVGQREAAPGSAQDGKRGGAVGWVEQSAGERGEVEDLLSLAEGLNLNRAEGNCIFLFQCGDDLVEMVAAADQDGDLPGFGAARRERLREPFADDAADLQGVAAGLLPLVLDRGEEICGRVVRTY